MLDVGFWMLVGPKNAGAKRRPSTTIQNPTSNICFLIYELSLVTPGISPFRASCRKHSRHSANLRRYPRGRPQRQQRFRSRQANFAVVFSARAFSMAALIFVSLAIFAVVAMLLLLPEGHPHILQERHALGVRSRRGGNRHVHPLGLVNLRIIDLRED